MLQTCKKRNVHLIHNSSRSFGIFFLAHPTEVHSSMLSLLLKSFRSVLNGLLTVSSEIVIPGLLGTIFWPFRLFVCNSDVFGDFLQPHTFSTMVIDVDEEARNIALKTKPCGSCDQIIGVVDNHLLCFRCRTPIHVPCTNCEAIL